MYWVRTPPLAPSESDKLSGQVIKYLLLSLLVGRQLLDLFGLTLHRPNEVVNHIGQLFYLYVLSINATVQLIDYPPYTIGGLPNEVNTIA